MERQALEELSRRELQRLAKENGIKANVKSAKIIESLLELQENVVPEVDSNSTPGEQPKVKEPLEEVCTENQEEEVVIRGGEEAEEPPVSATTVGEEAVNRGSEEAEEPSVTTTPVEEEVVNQGSEEAQEPPGSTAPLEEEVNQPTNQEHAIDADKVQQTAEEDLTQQNHTEKDIQQKVSPEEKTSKEENTAKAPETTKEVATQPQKKPKHIKRKLPANSNKENQSKKRDRFDKAHEKLFSQQKSIVDHKTPKRKKLSVRNPNTEEQSTKKKHKHYIFNLEESLKRPVTWKMKTGPLK